MSNRRTTSTRALERELLQAAARGDGPAVHRLAQECRRAFTHGELADALGRMALNLSAYAARVPEVERGQVTNHLPRAAAILAFKGIKL